MSRLISGLSSLSEGAVLIDGVDLRQIDKSDVRRMWGVMLARHLAILGNGQRKNPNRWAFTNMMMHNVFEQLQRYAGV